jgi:hypothetical protein
MASRSMLPSQDRHCHRKPRSCHRLRENASPRAAQFIGDSLVSSANGEPAIGFAAFRGKACGAEIPGEPANTGAGCESALGPPPAAGSGE